MKPVSHAFEIGYGASLEVLDHSEVFFECLPGTPAFSKILPKLEGKLNPDQMHEVDETIALLPRIQEWVRQLEAEVTFRIGDIDFTVTWQRPVDRAGIYSILADCKIASVSLLICRKDDLGADEPPGHDMRSLVAFMSALSRVVPGEDVYDYRKFRLVTMTQRPLMASMFWPPFSPTNDTVARTIQRQIAFAFFRLNGELC